MAGAFAVSGTVHLVRPQVFEPTMPRLIPAKHHRALIYLSGIAELACATGLVRRAEWAGPASVAVLVGVFPANVQMALDSGTGRNAGAADSRVLSWGRLPLQLIMVWAALESRTNEPHPR